MSRLRSRLSQAFGPRQSRVVSVRSRGRRGGGRDFRSILAALSQQQSQFNQGASARFAKVQRLSDRTRRRSMRASNRALRSARKIGASQKEELGRQAVKSKAGSQQSLASRGLGNTSIVEQQSRAIDEDVARQSRTIDEDIARRRMDIFQQQAGMEAGLGQMGIDTFLSRRQQAPNLSQTLQLLQQLGGGF